MDDKNWTPLIWDPCVGEQMGAAWRAMVDQLFEDGATAHYHPLIQIGVEASGMKPSSVANMVIYGVRFGYLTAKVDPINGKPYVKRGLWLQETDRLALTTRYRRHLQKDPS